MTKDYKSNGWKSKPLSHRASSLIKKLGGIESTIRYYQQHNTFVNLDKIGLATSNELIYHLENNLYINKLKEQTLTDQTNFNSSTIDLYQNLKKKCTVRSQNALIKIEPKNPSSFVEWKNFITLYFINDFNFLDIDNIGKKSLIELTHIKNIILENYNKVDANIHSLIKKLGGIESTMRYYQQHNTFVNLDKIGLATSNELIYHLESNLYINKLKEQTLADQTNFNSSTIDLYHNLKKKCTVRSQNALIKIEPKDPSSFVEWKNFITLYFINDFNFLDIDNIGKKSLIELIHIKDIILENYNKVDANIHLVDQNTNTLNSTINIYNILDKSIRIENINYIITKQLNPSLIFLCYLILIKNKNNLRNLFIKKYYFSQDNSNYNQLAKELKCSNERIRQIDYLLKKRIKNDYWPLLRDTINQYEMPNNDANIINIDSVDWNISVNFENEELKSNIKLKKIFFDVIFFEKYIDLFKALQNNKTKYKSFNVNGLNCYLKKEIILDLNIVDFFKWIDVEIYNFEIVEFDYNLEILIKRYFKENNYKYNDTTIKTLHEAILLIKKNIALENNFLKNKINKNLKTNEIINICVDNLNATNKPASTSQLLRIISGKGILTNRIELLSILGQNNSTFQRIGSGLWHLNNNIPDKNIRGSLRDITYNLLLSSRDPLHISEIINCISKYRSISEASLIGNLKMANNNVLQLFNCHFIGLKSKKYDNKWYNIPKFLGSHLSEYELNIAKIEYPKNIAEYFFYKYGYPLVHVNYLLSKKAFFIKK